MKLGYTLLYVTDVKRSVEFWERAFGLERKFIDDGGQYAELQTGGDAHLGFVAQKYIRETLPGGIRPFQKDEAPPPFEVALTTDDVPGALERAVQAGAHKVLAPTKKPWGQTVAYVRDCDGNLVELCTPMS
jgi:catechol 2,3-dioxygenase-like lactoylglutathione lyase family enzyme